jgi:hypothetical protein
MPRKRKSVAEPPSEAVDIPLERPDASEPAAPPSPDPKLTIGARPPQSPGMKAVKAAAYQARKADRIAKKAYMMFLQETDTFYQCCKALTDRGERLGKAWKKKGRPSHSNHLDKINNLLLNIEAKRVHLLQTQVVASELALDARIADIAERDARLARMRRLLQRKNGRVPRQL